MRLVAGQIIAAPTDLANFLACRHKTTLDLLVVTGALDAPHWKDPLADVLRQRGDEHERAYVGRLSAEGLSVVELTRTREESMPPAEGVALTVNAMMAGVHVIVQAPLRMDGWFGYADLLVRVPVPSALGGWSYEVHDTKLARETKGGTILQLCVYSDALGQLQKHTPEQFHVVSPVGHEIYRFDEFAAFYRQIKSRFLECLARETGVGRGARRQADRTYPEPVDHCDVCRWWQRCDAQRRRDDHVRFVAGLGRAQAAELESRGIGTLKAVADMALPLRPRPKRGSPQTYVRLQDQAALQLKQRDSNEPQYKLLPIAADEGLCRLPQPSPGDVFLDLEGDPFAGPAAQDELAGGREYLFGFGVMNEQGGWVYKDRWAFTDAEEKSAFEAVVDDINVALAAHPDAHIYHYAAYEPSAFRRLAARHATRESNLDVFLRGERFVDLYGIVRHALRAGVERYSIKDLEPFFNFRRSIGLDHAGGERRIVEHALETGDLAAMTPDVKANVAAYNNDDCRSALELRRWLETLRLGAIASGADIPRPAVKAGDASEKVSARDAEALQLRARLQACGQTLLSYLIDWHRREERVAYGEYHRLRDKDDEELLDEPGAIVGLTFVETLPRAPRARTDVCRYRYPVQENDLSVGDQLRLRTDERFGTVEAVDKNAGTIDVKKPTDGGDVHPTVVIALRIVNAPEQEKSLRRLGNLVADVGLDDERGSRVANDLLLRRPPRLRSGPFLPYDSSRESATAFAVRAVEDLDGSVLAIQGPPGTGKTYTGARMIAALVADGRKVGVVATSHKVIGKLLRDAIEAAREMNVTLPAAHKCEEGQAGPSYDGIQELDDNAASLAWIAGLGGRVLGGTAWLWSRLEFANAIDVLFVDEAGQMSLANALAVCQAARNLVLLGDPQQLEQPQQGCHPPGAGVSVLQHLLGNEKTIPPERGLLLPITWRLAPAICKFTSEQFYEGKLSARAGLERQCLTGSRFAGTGLHVIPVEHDGNRNASDEEVEVVAGIVGDLLAEGSMWIDDEGASHQMSASDILVVAPYNAQVNRLRARLAALDRIGTVDKFQGQEAPVVIYSMATSRPEDAPRGMSFLYSLNRLNVATSRAKCQCILVASPKLFEPECRTPGQMKLANGLASYREFSRDADGGDSIRDQAIACAGSAKS